MYSLETLTRLNRQEVNAYFRLHPLKRVLTPEDCRHAPDYSGGKAEAIASHYKVKVEKEFFVDSSGFGSDSEPALTFEKFTMEIRDIMLKNPARRYYCALTGVGQFQVFITLYYKEGK